jgi:saccharopepsin
MIANTKKLLVLAASASASILELPVIIKNTYVSVPISVGTPPKPYQLHFDTGSSTSWLLNTDCTETSCKDGSAPYYIRQSYNANASSSAIELADSASIPYLGGDIAGEIYQDVFSVGDAGLEWNQTFLSANQSSWRFITADGFMGLGFSSIAEPNTTTLVETLLQDGELDAPRFGLFYGTNLKDDGAQDGVLTLGGSHEDKYVDGEVVYTPLRKEDPYQLWRAPLRSVHVLVARNPSDSNSTVEVRNGQLPTTALPAGTYPDANVTWSMYNSGRAVFDTGAGRLSVPDEIISAMYYNLGWNYTKLTHAEERMDCQHLNASW